MSLQMFWKIHPLSKRLTVHGCWPSWEELAHRSPIAGTHQPVGTVVERAVSPVASIEWRSPLGKNCVKRIGQICFATKSTLAFSGTIAEESPAPSSPRNWNSKRSTARYWISQQKCYHDLPLWQKFDTCVSCTTFWKKLKPKSGKKHFLSS